MEESVRIELLGPVTLTGPSGAQRLGGPIARMLLVPLALARRRAVGDDELIDGVWGEFPPDSVLGALRVHISSLRTAARPLGLVLDRRHGGYVLDGPFALDTDDLDRYEAAAPRSGPSALHAATTALALWRGPSLADVRRMPLGDRLAAGYDRRRQFLIDRQAALLVESGRAAEAIAVIEPALALDPLNEARWALLALAESQSGRSAEALRTLERGRIHLAETVGLDPGPAMRDAERRILEHRIPIQVASRHVTTMPSALQVGARGPMVGRQSELEQLAGLVERTTKEATSIVGRVVGEPGSGKTLLAAHLAQRVCAEGVTVVYDACDETGEEPLAPITRILGSLRGARVSPDTVRVDSDQLDALAAGRASVLERAHRELTAIAVTGPVVIILDDVQWADELSATLLRRLARQPAPLALTVLAMERTGPSVLGSRGVVDVIVGSLGVEAVAEWVGRTTTDPEVHRLTELTGGLGWLVAEALVGLRDGPLPDALPTDLATRLLKDRLRPSSGTDRSLLEWGAVLGPSFDLDDLIEVTARPVLDVLEDLDHAVQARVVGFASDDPSHVQFDHALLRDGLLAGLGARRLSRMHRTVLDRLEHLTPLEHHHHVEQAVHDTSPAEYSASALRAGRWLTERFAFEEARRVAESALTREAHDAVVDRRVLVGLHVTVARAAAALGDPRAVRTHLDRAGELAGVDDDAIAMAEALGARSLLGQRFVPDPNLRATVTRLLDRLGQDHSEQRFRLLRLLAFEQLNTGQLTDAQQTIDSAREAGAALGPAALATMMTLEHWRWGLLGQPGRRRGVMTELETLARGTDDVEVRMRAFELAIIEALHDGDPAGAGELIERLHSTADAAGEPIAMWLARAARCTVHFVAADLDSAALESVNALRFGQEHGLHQAQATHATQRYALAWARGELAAFVEPLRGLDVSGPDFVWRAALALALAMDGTFAEADGILDRLVDEVAPAAHHWLGIVGVGIGVEAAYLTGHRPLLAAATSPLARRRHDHLVLGMGGMDYGPVARYEALALAGLGERERAIEQLDQVATNPRSGRIWQIRARRDLAVLAGAASDLGSGTATTDHLWSLTGGVQP